MASSGEDVYCTLLMSDSYLPGAQVLAHSLRDAGTRKKLAVLVTEDSLSASTIIELKKLYDYVIPVERIANPSLANLYLMDRWDLKSTFTKINLWRQCQFRKIVYIDADVVALRAPDELFDIQERFAAAPDVGWPDCFNSGVMVLNPNMADFYSLSALAQRGVSFDGADQGLLNTHFKNFHRISFRYNCTPSANYQYVPAYRHFESEIVMLHFIGRAKPWSSSSGPAAPLGSVYDELLARWWAVHDRHHRAPAAPSQPEPSTQKQGSTTPSVHHVFQPSPHQAFDGPATTTQDQPYVSAPALAPEEAQPHKPQEHHSTIPEDRHQGHIEHHPQGHHEYHPQDVTPPSEPKEVEWHPAGDNGHSESHPSAQSKDDQHAGNTLPAVPQEPFAAPHAEWDPAKSAPPVDAPPEAPNFPQQTYEMSQDPNLFKPPASYPEPPKDLWYEIPKPTPVDEPPKPIFPWELNAPKATRVFPDDPPKASATEELDDAEEDDEGNEEERQVGSPPQSLSTARISSPDPWSGYSAVNAWDEIPQIQNFIKSVASRRLGKLQLLQGGFGAEEASSPGEFRLSTKLTDFPSEFERPSLPVTPAPVRGPKFWGVERDEDGPFPAAQGVPKQEDWDPAQKLEELTRHQTEMVAAVVVEATPAEVVVEEDDDGQLSATEATDSVPILEQDDGAEDAISLPNTEPEEISEAPTALAGPLQAQPVEPTDVSPANGRSAAVATGIETIPIIVARPVFSQPEVDEQDEVSPANATVTAAPTLQMVATVGP